MSFRLELLKLLLPFAITIRKVELRHAEQGNDFVPDHKVAFKLISEVLDNRITRQNFRM